jgi:hypothetical protein
MKKLLIFPFVLTLLMAGIAPVEFDWTRFVMTITTTENTDITNLLQKALLSIQYDGARTIADYLLSHPGTDGRLRKIISDCTHTTQHFLTDGGMEYAHALPLTNRIMQELLPDRQPVQLLVPMLCPLCGREWPQEKSIPDTIALIPQQTNQSEYTGIIIDCRGYGLTPCLFPRILTSNGHEVYSANFAASNHIIEWGLVQYTTDADLRPPRAGREPLIIKAEGILPATPTDIVISLTDAQRIHGSTKNVQLLKECRVVIIF